jgi:hypothetical protein
MADKKITLNRFPLFGLFGRVALAMQGEIGCHWLCQRFCKAS